MPGVVPSVTSVWQGANLQEREAFDLMGISFRGHPDLKRIFLWEGFPGHPLRKDFLSMPGGYKPGCSASRTSSPRASTNIHTWGGRRTRTSRWARPTTRPSRRRTTWRRRASGRWSRRRPAGASGRRARQAGGARGKETDLEIVEDKANEDDDAVTELHTPPYVVNIGPQHPSTHGVFRWRRRSTASASSTPRWWSATCTAAWRSWPKSAPTRRTSPSPTAWTTWRR